MALSLVISATACQRKAEEPSVQAQVASQLQAKAAEDRVAQLEQQVADMKAGKSAATVAAAGDQETLRQVSAAHIRSLDRQLADARQRAAERRQDAATYAATPQAQRPRYAVLEVPSGTRITLSLANAVATDRDQPGDPWTGTTAEEVRVNGTVVWPAGTPVSGVVAQSTAAGRLSSGQGGLGIRLTTVGRNGVDAGIYLVVGDARGKRDAKFIGGTAALGALVGILSDRNHQGDHALGGAAAGAVAGTALAAGTADPVIRIPAGQPITFSLSAPEQVTLR